ncbi:zinc-binding dehydrogenase [Deinococcus sp. HMF7620]|uniref:Zinc-binding dehydrogenase n=1 Tax=Deinococcus arboris TaxID=2682977 RepID=A0A7C9LPV9_9DEIO|nr:zinc-binding dehydrogenase [Deinococcus arboris]MVN89137.1 zinc-binding dehydrogenase [Deinococcus arboris]
MGNGTENGYDIIIDPVGGPDAGAFLHQLRPNGRMICGVEAGFLTANVSEALMSGFQRSLMVSTFSLKTVAVTQQEAALEEVFGLMATGRLQPVIDSV